MFNDLLRRAGFLPETVAILRHHTSERGISVDTLAELWRTDPAGFKLYQETQKPAKPLFRKRGIWAAFVQPTPHETLFIGLYDAKLAGTRIADWPCPYRGDKPGDGLPVDIFTTHLRPELSEHIGKLRVIWPADNVRSWKRRAETLDLPIGTDRADAAKQFHGDALVSALRSVGFSAVRSTKKIDQLARGDLVVYVKRDTRTRPLVVHPRFLDIADKLADLDGIDVALPPRSYVNSNLRAFPHYVAEHRKSTGRHGFALGVATGRVATLVDLLQRHCRIETGEGEVRVVASDDPLTERERLQAARIGQGDFRDALIVAWGGTCPVAGVDHLPLLRASHIKPWKASTNAERLDPFNGLLLCAHVDALFDRGLISFEDDGRMLVSSRVSTPNLQRLALAGTVTIMGLEARHAPYLHYHRERCFTP